MDAIDFDNVKAEKAKAMRRYNRLRNIAKLFRLVEICLVLVLLSWISSRLPLLVKISGEYFRKLVAIAISPLFIFIIGNIIVFTLLAKSGQLSGQSAATDNAENDLYEELLKSGSKEIASGLFNSSPVPKPEEIVYQDKQIISEANTVAMKADEAKVVNDLVSDSKALQRSQSEKMKRESLEKTSTKLRRSETERCPKFEGLGEVPPVDELSNEEFQRAIEEYIAKQVKFHKEEKLAIVTS